MRSEGWYAAEAAADSLASVASSFCIFSAANKKVASEVEEGRRMSEEALGLKKECSQLAEALRKAQMELGELRERSRKMSQEGAQREQTLEAENVALSQQLEVRSILAFWDWSMFYGLGVQGIWHFSLAFKKFDDMTWD